MTYETKFTIGERSESLANLIHCRLSELNDEARTFSGYANVFDVVDDYKTSFARGSFTDSIAEWKAEGRMPHMFFNHQHYSLPIGKWIDIEEDDYGLRVTGKLFDTQEGADIYTVMKESAIDGLSVGFIPQEYRANDDPANPITFTKVGLSEISVVVWPSNDPSRIDEVRSMLEDGMSVRELESYLKKLGVSRQSATAIASQFESKSELKRVADEKAILDAMDAFIRATR